MLALLLLLFTERSKGFQFLQERRREGKVRHGWILGSVSRSVNGTAAAWMFGPDSGQF